MKINKIYFSFMAMLAMMLTACSSDDDYRWASVSGTEVYFSNTLESTVELSADANSFNVPLNRIDASEELTVNLNVTQEEGSILSIPTSVTFAKGEKETTITVNYEPTAIVYGNYEELSIQIADEKLTTPYGAATYTFKAGATAWMDWGMGFYREDCMTTFFGVDNPIGEVMIQRNVIEEGKYRMVNAYGEAYAYNEPGDWDDSQDYYITIDATDPNYVYVEKSNTGMDWSYGEVSIQSMVSFYLGKGNTLEAIKNEHPEYFGTLKDGVITMPAESMLISMADHKEGGWFVSNANGLFAVALPGSVIADYSAEVSYNGIYTNAAGEVFAIGNLTLGNDANTVKAVVVENDDDADEVATAIAAGEIEAIDVNSGNIALPIGDLTGELQIVVAVIADNAVQTVATAKFEYYGGGAEPWTSLGTGYYTDDFVVPLYTEEGAPYTYKVEIQESTDVPGLYRIVNAYAPVANAFGEAGGNENITIHAEDTTGVYFINQPVGLDFGDGEISIESEAGGYVAQYGFDMVKNQLPEVFGTLQNGVVTLPMVTSQNGVNYQGVTYLGTNGYYGGMNGAFKLVLPNAANSVKAKAKSMATATKFEQRLKSHAVTNHRMINKMATKTTQVLR